MSWDWQKLQQSFHRASAILQLVDGSYFSDTFQKWKHLPVEFQNIKDLIKFISSQSFSLTAEITVWVKRPFYYDS